MTSTAELYQEMFDPDAYYSPRYACLRIEDNPVNERQSTFRDFQLAKTHQFYSTLESQAASEKRLHILEFGGGPSIAPLISAVPYAEKMVFSDFVGRNREFVDSWRKCERSSPDFLPLIQFVVQSIEEKDHDEAKRREQELRDKLHSVVHCDIRENPPIHGLELYDVISTHLCLVSACESIHLYREGLQKLSALVRPGGSIVASDVLGESFYMVGDLKFPVLSVTRDIIYQALIDAGFQDDICFSSMAMEGDTLGDAKEYLFSTAKKSGQVQMQPNKKEKIDKTD